MGLLIANLYSHLITGCVWRSLRFLAFLYRARQFRLSRGCWSPPATITICPLTLYSHYWAFALEFGCGSTLVIVVCVCVCIICMRACCEGAPCMHAHARMHTCMHAHRARTSGSSAEVPSLTAGRGDYPPRPRGRRFGSPPLAGQLAILSSPKVGSKKIFFVFFVEFGINGKSKTSWTWHQNRSVWDEAASPGSLISMGT